MANQASIQHWQIAVWTAGGIFGALTFIVGLIVAFSKMNKGSRTDDKFNEFLIQQAKYMTNMQNLSGDIKSILIKLSDRQEETRDVAKEIEHIQESTHKRIGKIESTTEVLKAVITKDTIKESVKSAYKDLGLA